MQYRGALRIACSYRTVSVPASLVIAGVIPIDLLALGRKRIYSRTREVDKPSVKTEARKNTMTIWHQRWDSELKGRWNARLIPRLSSWVDRQHEEVDFYLKQFFTGHGLLRACLYKVGKVSNPSCVYCGGTNDDANHTFFQCDCWAAPRSTLEIEVGQLILENIIEVMLESEESWEKISAFVEMTLRQKKIEDNLALRPS